MAAIRYLRSLCFLKVDAILLRIKYLLFDGVILGRPSRVRKERWQ